MENIVSQAGASGLLALIRAYQRWISPRKGYACAYRVQYGGTGCSGFAKRALSSEGLCALPRIRARLRACQAAAMAHHEDSENSRKRKDRWYDYCDVPCYGGDVFGCLFRPRHRSRNYGDSGADCDVGSCDISW